MSATAEALVAPSRRITGSTVAALALIILAAIVKTIQPTTADISWLVTVGHRIFDGDRLYVDVIETNPPMSVLLYLPAVLFERWTGLAAEGYVIALVLAAVTVSTLAAEAILVRVGALDAPGGPFRVAAAFALAVMPLKTFGQKDHVGLLLLLPLLAVIAGRAQRWTPASWLSVAVGSAAGLAIAIKPQFALPILVPSLLAATRTRSWQPIVSLANVTAGGVVVLFTGLVLIGFPAYLEVIWPMVAGVYRPFHSGYATLLFFPSTFIVLAFVLATFAMLGRRALDAWPSTILVGSLACLAAAYEQGRGWPYHTLPAIGLALLAATTCTVQIASGAMRRGRLADPRIRLPLAGILVWGAMLGPTVRWFDSILPDPAPLAEALGRLAPSHSTVLGITGIGYEHAFPAVRMSDARWVGTVGSQWLSGLAIRLSTEAPNSFPPTLMAPWIELDRAMLRRDITTNRPDIVLIQRGEFDWLAFAMEDRALASALDGYARAETVGEIEIWLRRPDR